MEVLRELAAKEGICVVATHDIGVSVTDAAHMVVELGVRADVNPVISLLDAQDSRRFMAALANNTGKTRLDL